jgi:hypothetical protein
MYTITISGIMTMGIAIMIRTTETGSLHTKIIRGIIINGIANIIRTTEIGRLTTHYYYERQ